MFPDQGIVACHEVGGKWIGRFENRPYGTFFAKLAATKSLGLITD